MSLSRRNFLSLIFPAPLVPIGNLHIRSGDDPVFAPLAVVFEGDTYLLRNGRFTGAKKSRCGSLSLWLQVTRSEDVSQDLIRSTMSQQACRIYRDTSNKFALAFSNGPDSFAARTRSTITSKEGLVHFCASWDMSGPAGRRSIQLFRNGISDHEVTLDRGDNAFFINYEAPDWAIGATTLGTNRLSGILKEVLFWPGVLIDWSDPTYLNRVYDRGMPVDPGKSGQLVIGVAPTLYLSCRDGQRASVFACNRGTGGGFE